MSVARSGAGWRTGRAGVVAPGRTAGALAGGSAADADLRASWADAALLLRGALADGEQCGVDRAYCDTGRRRARGAEASVWYGAVLRADFGPIVVRRGANVQEDRIVRKKHV